MQVALAGAVLVYLTEHARPRTLFATHYHSLASDPQVRDKTAQ
jgi:DNA mismatch repair ATPase MutS